MGTHSSKVQGKWEHKKTQPKEKTKANNQPKQKKGKDPMQRELFKGVNRSIGMSWIIIF